MSTVLKRVEKEAGRAFRLQLHIKPGAKRSQIMEIRPEFIDMQISAPPRDGEANEEVVRFVAELLGLRSRNVELVGGHRSREKTVLLRLDDTDSRTDAELIERLQSSAKN